MRPEHWWKDRPDWVDALYGAKDLEEIEWLSEGASGALRDEHRASLRGGFAGYDFAPEVLEESAAGDFVPLGLLPERTDRRGLIPYRPMIVADARRPEQAFVAFDRYAPSFAWIPAGTSPGTFRQAWAPYAIAELPPRVGLARERRWFVGTVEQLGSLDQIARAMDGTHGLDGLCWGSSFDEDPWPPRVEANALAIARASQDALVQSPAAPPSISRRTIFSGSVVTVWQCGALLALSIRYRPVPHAAIYEAMNERFGTTFPTDLPIDAFLAFCRFPLAVPPERVEAALRDPAHAETRAGDAMVHALLRHDDLGKLSWLFDEILAVPGDDGRPLRDLAIGLADSFQDVSTLCAMLEVETDPQLRSALLELTSPRGGS
jgi:hypothetical protein